MRLEECSEELSALMIEETLLTVPVLIYANKQDLQTSLDAEEISESMKLESIKDREWNI